MPSNTNKRLGLHPAIPAPFPLILRAGIKRTNDRGIFPQLSANRSGPNLRQRITYQCTRMWLPRIIRSRVYISSPFLPLYLCVHVYTPPRGYRLDLVKRKRGAGVIWPARISRWIWAHSRYACFPRFLLFSCTRDQPTCVCSGSLKRGRSLVPMSAIRAGGTAKGRGKYMEMSSASGWNRLRAVFNFLTVRLRANCPWLL